MALITALSALDTSTQLLIYGLLTVHVGEEPVAGADLVLPAGAKPDEAVRAIGQLLRQEKILLGL